MMAREGVVMRFSSSECASSFLESRCDLVVKANVGVSVYSWRSRMSELCFPPPQSKYCAGLSNAASAIERRPFWAVAGACQGQSSKLSPTTASRTGGSSE